MSQDLDWLDGADLSQFDDQPAPAGLPRPGRDRRPQGIKRETWSNTWSAAWWATQTPEQRRAMMAKRVFRKVTRGEQWRQQVRQKARELWANPEWVAANLAARDAARRALRTPEQEARYQARKAHHQALALRRESLGVTDLRVLNKGGGPQQQKYRYHTPAGVFDRRNKAAQANGVSNTDLVRLCLKATEPDFWREDMKNRTTYQVWRLAKGSDTWTRYKHIPECQSEQEAQHLLKCHRAGTYKGQQFKSWMRDDQFRVIRSDCTYLGLDQ